jgi:Tfp pilus assembly protein PilW
MFPKESGLTLLEIIIAILILALVMAGLVNLFISGKRWILHSRARMTGAELGRVFLDPLQMQVRQSDWGNSSTNQLFALSWSVPELEGGLVYDSIYSASSVLDPGGNDTGLRRVNTSITWTDVEPD